MKSNKLKQIIMTCISFVAIIVVTVAFTIAWYQVEIADPYHFEITADGVLYIYVDTVTVNNEENLVPAVAVPGAIQEGLNYDVLRTYNPADPNPSYIQKAASVTNMLGSMTIYNQGFGYEKVPLPQDENGYTLYPLIDKNGDIVWKDDSDHSLGWEEFIMPTEYNNMAIPIEWSKKVDYEPKLVDGKIQWKAQYVAGDKWEHYGEDYWECKEVVSEGASAATVNFNIAFKASESSDVDDYYGYDIFKVKRIYFSPDAEKLPDGAVPGVGNDAKAFDEISADNISGAFTIYGSEKLYLHAEVYLAYPDELLEPTLRGKNVYLSIKISVEVKGTDEN